MNCLIVEDRLESIHPIIRRLKRMPEVEVFYSQERNCQNIAADLMANLPWRPDVVLLDLMMAKKPGEREHEEGGLDFYRKLRAGEMADKIPRDTPIVALSAFEELERVRKEEGDNIQAYVAKPCSTIHLVETLFQAAGEPK